MKYTAVFFKPANPSVHLSEIIIAELSNQGFEGFLETETGVVGYISSDLFEELNLDKLLFNNNPAFGKIEIETEFILDKNWNELWESNYEPAIISDKVIVRAPFHAQQLYYEYEIIIEPKMSFGTGHHETTSLMMEQILTQNLAGKSVLDVGCGTGVLGILTSKMGADKITALDINEWAYENTIENVSKNKINNLKVIHGGIDLIREEKFDLLLANITRNVLMDEIPAYSEKIKSEGIMILSGILMADLEDIKRKAESEKLQFESYLQKKDWIAVKFFRN